MLAFHLPTTVDKEPFDEAYVISANSLMEVESDISTHYCGNNFSLAHYQIKEITEEEYWKHDDRRKF